MDNFKGEIKINVDQSNRSPFPNADHFSRDPRDIHKNVGEDRDIIAYCYSEEKKE